MGIIDILLKEASKKERNLVLYRGESKDFIHPTDDNYKFFAEDKEFAEDYGDYIWKCTFENVHLFISWELDSIKELYNKGFKLRDGYIEDSWETYEEEGMGELYDYNENDKNGDNWGYKTPESVTKTKFFDTDTWEMIEMTEGVMEYILSKYDGVALLEGGAVTYYIDTHKITNCDLIENKINKI